MWIYGFQKQSFHLEESIKAVLDLSWRILVDGRILHTNIKFANCVYETNPNGGIKVYLIDYGESKFHQGLITKTIMVEQLSQIVNTFNDDAELHAPFVPLSLKL